MFGLGKKDADGRQVRIEHRGKYTRASRTGGVALRIQQRLGRFNFTANTARGLRASTQVAKGARVALQNGKFRLIGRWQCGPMNFNLSKTGGSASMKTDIGAFNFIKPRYSSVKIAGVQFRGKNAVYMHLIYFVALGAFHFAMFAFRLAVFFIWLLILATLFVRDFIAEFIRAMREGRDHE